MPLRPVVPLLLAGLVAVASPGEAQEADRWLLQAHAAAADIDDRGTKLFGGVRLGRAFHSKGTFVLDFGYGAAGGDFSIVDVGFEYRSPLAARVGAYVRVQVGQLSEYAHGYPFLGAGAGVLVRVTPRLHFRAGVLVGTHIADDASPRGPYMGQAGFEFRF
jgi:hypothetical protein